MAWQYIPRWILVTPLVLAGCTAMPIAPRPATAPSSTATPSSAATPSPQVHWQRAGPLPRSDARLHAAPYFIEVFDGHAEVVDFITGKVTATIRRSSAGYLTGAAAAGDDRTFVLAAEPPAASQPPIRYYELRLDRNGVPGPLRPLAVPRMSGQQLPFALSTDGGELAISDFGSALSSPGEIVVVSLAAGTTRTWRSADRGGGALNLSWAGNSRLAFDWMNPWLPTGKIDRRAGVWLLDTRKSGQNLFAASRLVIPASAHFGSYTRVYNPLISPDGSVLFAAMALGGISPQAVAVEFSARTGRPRRAVSTPADESGHGSWCGALWTDPSGQHALANCGGFLFRVDHGRFTRVTLRSPGGGGDVGNNFFAW